MERIAIFSDVHANITALDAVLDDISKRNINKIICLGDLVYKGVCPAEVIDKVKEKCDIVLRGNCDAYIGIGKGVAGRVNMNGVWYEQRGNNEQFDILNDDARAVEKIITGIRTVRGVKLSADVVKQIDFDYVKNHPDLINQNDEYLSATSKGFLLLDNITLDLIK